MTDTGSSDTPAQPRIRSYPSAQAYRFFREHRGRTFKLEELERATGWSVPTIRTYIAKRWSAFLQSEGQGLYRLLDFDLSEEEFVAQQSQLAPRYDYDVTLSFAGEDRAYVEKVAAALYSLGIRVFYDRYEQVDLWGKDLYTHPMTYTASGESFVSSSYHVIMLTKYGPITSERVRKPELLPRHPNTFCQFALMTRKYQECFRRLVILTQRHGSRPSWR